MASQKPSVPGDRDRRIPAEDGEGGRQLGSMLPQSLGFRVFREAARAACSNSGRSGKPVAKKGVFFRETSFKRV